MIHSCKFTKGYALELPCIGTKNFKFKPGFNVLFGPNACGKSTILKALANYSSIKTGGWSRLQEPLDLVDFGNKGATKLPQDFAKLSRKAFEAQVDWDGTPTFYHHAKNSDAGNFSYLVESADESHDGMTTMEDQLATIFGHPSQGQQRITKMVKLFQLLKQPPVLTSHKEKANSVWMECYDRQVKYFNSLPRTGPVTVILDEPESSLDITNQIAFWSKVMPMLKQYQVIVATHSPFLFTMPGEVNLIDMHPGYAQACRDQLLNLKFGLCKLL